MGEDVTEKTPSGSHRRWWIALVVCLFLVGYPLSVGPVTLLVEEYQCMPNAAIPLMNAVYAPIIFLHGKSALVRDFYDWYMPLWRDDT